MRGIMVVVALFLSGCASSLRGPGEAGGPDLSGVLGVSSQDRLGHVCPVSPTQALTAEHVSTWRSPWDRSTWTSLALVVEVDGRPVIVQEYSGWNWRDLSIVKIITEGATFPKWYKMATERPEPGDNLWLRGYDMGEALRPSRTKAQLKNIRTGLLYFEPTPLGGSSGSCILNDQEEVVGVQSHYYVTDSSGSLLGTGQLVVGPWAPSLEVRDGDGGGGSDPGTGGDPDPLGGAGPEAQPGSAPF
jgi:hypothetical protein